VSAVAQGAQQGRTFRAVTELVEVDVIVTDPEGRPVTGLTATDFEVLEAGHPQSVAEFRAVDIARGGRRPVEAPPQPTRDVASNTVDPDSRLVVLFVDDLHLDLTPESMFRIRELLQDFLTELSRDDEVAVVFASRSDLSRDFTSDLGSQMSAIDGLRAALGTRSMTTLAKYHDAQRTLTSLRTVTAALAGSRHARRALVYVSEGPAINLNPPPGSDGRAEMVRAELMATINAARASGVVVYSLDPRGLLVDPTPDDFIKRDFVFALAHNTGGRAVFNRSDMAGAVRDVVGENSQFYVLGYYPEPLVRDGSYRQIQVRVRNSDWTVRSRYGYLAPSTPTALAPPTTEALAELLARGSTDGSVSMRAMAVPVGPSGDGRTRVRILGELHYPEDAPVGPDTVIAVALGLDPDARELDSTTQTLEFHAAADLGPDRAWMQTLILPPGRAVVRVGARSELIGRAGSVHLSVDVPDFEARIAMTTPVFGWPDGGGLAATDFDERVAPFEPTLKREFEPDDPPDVYVVFFFRSSEATDLSTSLTLSRDGQVLLRRPVLVPALPVPGRADRRTASLRLTLPLAGLASGQYLIDVSARTADGRSASRLVSFSVR
jgi:VWFA-related protein